MIENIPMPSDLQESKVPSFAKRLLHAWWAPYILAVFFIALDTFSGPYIQFPVLFVLSVAMASWFGSFRQGVILAIGQPMLNWAVALILQVGIPGMPVELGFLNAVIRGLVLVMLAYFVARSSEQHRALARRVGLLRGEIPTCVSCHKAQDEMSVWIPLETYVARHTGANFSDSMCPECKSHFVENPPRAEVSKS